LRNNQLCNCGWHLSTLLEWKKRIFKDNDCSYQAVVNNTVNMKWDT
jgi:hypothetical protein